MSVEERLERIENLLLIGSKEVLNADETALMLGISVRTLRNMTSARKIPHYKQGASVFYKKSEIEAWQCENRIPTNAEIERRATTHCVTNHPNF